MLNEWANLALILMVIAGMIGAYFIGKSVGYSEAKQEQRNRRLIYDRNRLMR